MSVTQDIIRTYRAPRAVVRRHLDAGQREDRAIAILMAACVVIFVAQWPLLSRKSFEDPGVPLQALLGEALLGWVFMMPLVFYGLAAVSRIVAMAFGGRGTWYSARISLFWTLLAVSPLMLFRGLVAGFIGPSPALMIADFGVTAAFFVIWIQALRESEGAGHTQAGQNTPP